MASSFYNMHIQVVFSTKNRERTLIGKRDVLFNKFEQLLAMNDCIPLAVNGMEEHIHLLFKLGKKQTLVSVIRNVKAYSSQFISEKKLFPLFEGWQTGYAAFTYSRWDLEKMINYVKGQEEHHRKKTFEEEYIELLEEEQVNYDMKYVFD